MISWKWITLSATVFLAVMAACAAIYESYTLAVIGFGVAIPVVYISKTNAKKTGEVIEDELTWKISADSSLWTMMVALPILAITSIVLIIGNDSIGDWAESSGYTMSMTIMLIVLVYATVTMYKHRRMSGE